MEVVAIPYCLKLYRLVAVTCCQRESHAIITGNRQRYTCNSGEAERQITQSWIVNLSLHPSHQMYRNLLLCNRIQAWMTELKADEAVVSTGAVTPANRPDARRVIWPCCRIQAMVKELKADEAVLSTGAVTS